MAPGADEDPSEPTLPEVPPAALDVDEAADALGVEPGELVEALEAVDLTPDEAAQAVTGAHPQEAVAGLAEALDRSEAGVAVGLAEALEVQEDALVDMVRRLEADPGDFAEEIRRSHLQDILESVDVGGWLPFGGEDEEPTPEEVIEGFHRAEKQVVAGGLFVAALLVAFGLLMFNAPPFLREVLWIVLGAVLVVAGLGLIVALVRFSELADHYIDRFETVADEFEGDSVSVVAEVANSTTLGRRAREAAMRRAWRLFRQAQARGAADDEAPEGEETEPEAAEAPS